MKKKDAFNGLPEDFKRESFNSAVQGFWPVFDWIKQNKNRIPSEDFIGFCCNSVSQIGNIFWECQDMENALYIFQTGIRLLENYYGDIRNEELDYHNQNHVSVFYVIEYYASVQYSLGNKAEAEKYFGILKSIDKHNHLRADIALVFLSQGFDWDQYVEHLDKIMTAHNGSHSEEQSAVS